VNLLGPSVQTFPLLPLEYIPAGEWAEVENVTGEPLWVNRMAELGLRAGIRLQVVRQGSPCLLQIGCSRLSLRNHASAQIWVRALATD
jgi:ferrous iron transport protein A